MTPVSGEASSAAVRIGWPPGLPVPLTGLVGRERELADVVALAAANRLVTLTGAGGVGKTRLAVEAAATVAAGFGDGADFIDLSAVAHPGLLPGAMAQRLGVEDLAGAGLGERLVRVLRGQHRLLVADNCEHLRGACADLVTVVLSECPGIAVLATSRERLGVPGEVIWRVPSLAFPWPEHPPAAEELEGFEAAALFLARARAARPGLQVGAGEVPAITSICYRLDGIPLALELAAARAGAMSLAEIAARLTGRMEVLGGARAGPARQQTLAASVKWSHQLLPGPERAVFRRLAVFAGGWPLEAAEAVCALPPVQPGEVAGLLASLVDKSLVQADHTAAASRYRLLEVIRAFAAERLAEAGELGLVRERHASYFTGLAEEASAEVYGHGPRLAGWVRRMDTEAGNLRAARDWCAEDPARASTGLRLAAGIWGTWYIGGRLAEAAAWLKDALAGEGGPWQARAVALNGLGLIACFRGEPGRGRDLFAASIECFQRSPDRRGEGRALSNLGYARAMCGDAAGAAEANDQALALGRRTADAWVEAAALWRSGFNLALVGDLARARALAASGAELFGKTGDSRFRAYAQMTVGDCLTREGRPAEAVTVLREALAVFEALPERWGLLRATSHVAEACGAAGDWPRAAMLLGVVDALSERTGGQPYPFMQARLGMVAAQASAKLGAAWEPARQAGRVLGRADQISPALWPPVAASAAPGDRDGLPLTPRERQIAALIADGLTNRQIGARLFIAERTVDTHVGRILAKLGCTSRAQVAALVAATAALAIAPGPPASSQTPAGS